MSFPHENLTVAEAAQMLRIGKSTLHKHVLVGAVPSVRLGGRRFLRREDVERLNREGFAPAPAKAAH